MQLDLTEEQGFFAETARRFLAAEMPMTLVRELHDHPIGYEQDWWSSTADLGWTSMLVPEGTGGGNLSGQPVADAALIAEEIGRQLAPSPYLAVNLVALALGADADAHAAVLGELLEGRSVATWAFAEPADQWDVGSMSCAATTDGDHVVIDGVKAYVEAGEAAAYLLVVARHGGGVSQILVPTETAGVTVATNSGLDLGRRFATVTLDSVRLPIAAIVGTEGQAEADVERLLQVALVLQCADTIGGMDAVFDFTLEYMNDRFAFGRPIASYQALKHRVADLALILESAKGATDGAIAAIDSGADDAALLARAANAYVCTHSPSFIQECVQFHGGIGVTWEHDLHLYLRRATTNRALYGGPALLHEQLCMHLELAGENS